MIPQDPLDRAVAALRGGQPDEAKRILEGVLGREPRHAEALHLLGLVALQSGAFPEAIDRLTQATEVAPRAPAVWSNLGVAQAGAGDFAAALRSHERALKLEPALAGAHRNRAVALRHLGRFEESLASARQAASRGPQDPEAWRAVADALVDLGRVREAIASYDRAVALAPRDATALHNRGTARYQLGDAQRAADDYAAAIAATPAFAKAHESLALVLNDLGRPAEALDAAERAVALAPSEPAFLVALGVCLDQLGRSDEALARFDSALAARPDLAAAWSHRAVALAALGRDEEAGAAHRKAFELDPRDAYTLVHRLHLRRRLCDGRGDAQLAARIRELAVAGAPCPPFALLHVPATPALQRTCAEGYARETLPSVALGNATPRSGQRIHVAYFSADFREHPVAQLVAPLIERHDRARFEVSAFSFGPAADALGERIRRACERFEDVGAMADAEVAALARKLKVDVAIDLMGYTERARPAIFAHGAAPVQAQYLGFPGTMGTAAMDCLFADATVVPEADIGHYAEKVIHLPATYQANDLARAPSTPPPPRASLGLPESGTVLCCFNDRLKITPEAFAAWMRIVSKIERSVLWLVDGGDLAKQHLREAAAAHGVAADRLVFAPRVPLGEHLARVQAADLALDTFPYNGHATTSDTLLAGVPVVTWLGATFAGRVAASLLRAVGMPELVADSVEGYEALAVALASDPQRLAQVRSRLLRNRDTEPLFDVARFARDFEAALVAMRR